MTKYFRPIVSPVCWHVITHSVLSVCEARVLMGNSRVHCVGESTNNV